MRLDHAVVATRNLDALAARYEALGFTLTPRARHPWGTANRLVQFEGGNFIELLEIDRPELLGPAAAPVPGQRLGFGEHVRDFLGREEGMCMLALHGVDSGADIARWRAAGLDTYAPFGFERQARLPDGSSVTVAFSLAFATHPALPGLVFFTCHNRFPEHFWKPAFQRHANGSVSMAEVVIAAPDAGAVVPFLAGFTGVPPSRSAAGTEFSSGAGRITVVDAAGGDRPRFRALRLEVGAGVSTVPSSCEVGGVTLEWFRRA